MENADEERDFFDREATVAFNEYRRRLDAGMARETARGNLPLSSYTQWIWKIDLQNLFHFLSLRLHSHAQLEIRVFAEAMAQLIQPFVPISYAAFEDYRLNGMFLTRQDVETLREFIATELGTGVQELPSDRHYPTKREYDEFLGKLSRLGLEAE